MKKIQLIALSLFAAILANAKSDTLITESAIKNVTVFLKGGEITRKANVRLPKGTVRVLFNKLSPHIDVNSIQLKSMKDITILSVVHQYNHLDQPDKPVKIKQLEKQKKELQYKMEMEQSMIAVYKQEEQLILANKKLSSEQLGVDIEELKKAAQFYREKLTEIRVNQLGIKKKLEVYNQEMIKLNNQLKELTIKKTSKTSEIIVTMASKNAINTELVLSYFVDQCGWVPKYNLRAKNVDNPLELNYKAEVYQKTGYDWKDIDLVLSTGEPLKSGTKPKLEKWVINNWSTTTGKNRGSGKNFTSTSFKLKTKYSIPTNGKSYSADLIDYQIPATYKYSCVPKIEEAAFLMAQITDWEQYNLLNGQVNLFFEGTFVGKSNLDVTTPEDTLVFSLGRDKNVIIKREQLEEFNKNQLLGNKKVEMFAWEISIRNNKSQEIELTIEDQVPISKSREIDVKHINLDNAQLEEKTGIIKWQLKLKPAENKKVSFKYEVKYPADVNLGL